MNRGYLLVAAVLLAAGAKAAPLPDALKPVQTIQLPSAVQGPFDHFGIDLAHNRLFATAENYHAVLVVDINSGKVVHEIHGLAKPHAVLYRSDLNRIYVTDGVDGSLKIFDGNTYQLISRIPLEKDADSIGYDPATHLLYIVSGGKDVGESSSSLTTIDTTADRKVANLKIEGETLEAMRLDIFRPKLYLNNTAKNEVDVINRFTNKVIARWPITEGTRNVAMALDEVHQRLFTACRSGQLVIFDTNTGKELQALPITQGVDDMTYDAASKRLYVVGNGTVDVIQQSDADHYVLLSEVHAAPIAKTASLVPQLDRYYVAAPATAKASASIVVFEPVNTPPYKADRPVSLMPVHAPLAEQLVLSTLSSHPDLRKLGLHAIPPGQTESVIIANGDRSRIGKKSSKGDLEAVKDGKTYCGKKEDGAFYNMKLPLFDAAGKSIGILVMEIPFTSAASESDAIHMAESIRAGLAKQIPQRGKLFAN